MLLRLTLKLGLKGSFHFSLPSSRRQARLAFLQESYCVVFHAQNLLRDGYITITSIEYFAVFCLDLLTISKPCLGSCHLLIFMNYYHTSLRHLSLRSWGFHMGALAGGNQSEFQDPVPPISAGTCSPNLQHYVKQAAAIFLTMFSLSYWFNSSYIFLLCFQ